jgi:hypothetical protein
MNNPERQEEIVLSHNDPAFLAHAGTIADLTDRATRMGMLRGRHAEIVKPYGDVVCRGATRESPSVESSIFSIAKRAMDVLTHRRDHDNEDIKRANNSKQFLIDVISAKLSIMQFPHTGKEQNFRNELVELEEGLRADKLSSLLPSFSKISSVLQRVDVLHQEIRNQVFQEPAIRSEAEHAKRQELGQKRIGERMLPYLQQILLLLPFENNLLHKVCSFVLQKELDPHHVIELVEAVADIQNISLEDLIRGTPLLAGPYCLALVKTKQDVEAEVIIASLIHEPELQENRYFQKARSTINNRRFDRLLESGAFEEFHAQTKDMTLSDFKADSPHMTNYLQWLYGFDEKAFEAFCEAE